MSKTHLLTVHANGTATRLHSEKAFTSQQLGRVVKNKRVSDITFNTTTQEWEVHSLKGIFVSKPLFSHALRSKCVEWEHSHYDSDTHSIKGDHGM